VTVAGERIDNLSEAHRLVGKYKPMHDSKVRPNDNVGARPVHDVSATGMNGVEVDLGRLKEAESKLAEQHGALVAQMREAARLTGPLHDGTSPVAAPMRRAFLHRADVDGGVQGILRDYLAEVFAVRLAIADTLQSYQALDDDTAAVLRQQAADLDTEVH
jgi:hypothetical protein